MTAEHTQEEQPPPAETGLDERLLQHSLRIAVLADRADRAVARVADARFAGVPDFRAARNKGIKTVAPTLPDGTEVGLISIKAGAKSVDVDEDLLILAVAPGDLETYVLPAALEDERVLKLLMDFLPEMVGKRVIPKLRAELQTELEEHDGSVANRMTGEQEKVATITRHEANGQFSYRPGKLSQQQISAAIEAGLITADGEIPDGRANSSQESIPS